MSGKVNAGAVLFGDGSVDDDVVDFSEIVEAAGDEPGEEEAGDGDDLDAPADADSGDDSAADDDDADVGDDDGDGAEVDENAGAQGDEDGDGAGEGDAGGAQQPALKYADQVAAERAYEELRAEHNRLLWERQQAQIQQQQQAPVPQVQAAQPDASQDPVGAFRAAIAEGDDDSAGRIIATVSLHATQFAAQAQQLRAEGEDDAASLYESRALNATSFAEQMRHERLQAEYDSRFEEHVTPLHTAAYEADLNAAAVRAFADPVIQGAYKDEHTQQIAEYIRQYPQVMGDGSPQAAESGFKLAAQQVIFGGQQQMVEYLVAQRVAEQLAEQQAAAKPAAARGGGGGAGRRRPAPTRTPEQSGDDEIRDSLVSNIPSGMSVLFDG